MTCANKVSTSAIPKVMEDTISVRLQHLGMNVEARVTQLRNLFGQQFHTVDRITKDDRLVDL